MDFQNLESEIYKEIEDEILLSALEDEAQKELDEEKTLKKLKSKTKRKRKEYTATTTLKSGLKIKTVLLLLVTLIINTYAWFIYISTVSMSISMHVKNWSFELSNGDQTQDFEFNVAKIYPGMETQSYAINAKNGGETTADLSCEIMYLKVLDEEYTQGESYIDENGVELKYTSDKLFEILTSYPFKIEVYFDDVLYEGEPLPMLTTDETNINFKVSWAYETGTTDEDVEKNDEIDTYWGKAAYDYMNKNPDSYCIEVKAKILAVQNNEINADIPATP